MKITTKQCDKCDEEEHTTFEFEQRTDPNYIREIKIPGTHRGKGMRTDLCPKHHLALIGVIMRWLTGVATLDDFTQLQRAEKIATNVLPDSETIGNLADDGKPEE